jgi:hypothetical protein
MDFYDGVIDGYHKAVDDIKAGYALAEGARHYLPGKSQDYRDGYIEGYLVRLSNQGGG